MLPFLMFLGLYMLEGEPKPSPEGCPPESELVIKKSKINITESCFRRGTQVLHGPRRSYELNGRLYQETFYADGVQDGLHRTWVDGRLRVRGVYKAGKEVGFMVQLDPKRDWRPAVYGYKQRPPEAGIYRQWHWRGPKETWYNSISSFKGGERYGRTWQFHKNGRLHTQEDYFESRLLGRALTWDDAGRFKSGTCYDRHDQLVEVWSTASYEEAITRPCPPEARLGKDLLPVGDHRIPPPSAATHDLVPPEVQADFPDLLPPKPPPYPPGPDDVGPPEVEPYFNPEDR